VRLSHGYKGVTVRLHFGPFVRRRNPGQAESTSGLDGASPKAMKKKVVASGVTVLLLGSVE